MKPRAFIQAAKGGHVGGAYLIYGSDEFIKTETVRLAARGFLNDSDASFGITHLVATQTDAQDILARAQSVPMLGSRSVVVIHEVQKLAAAHKTRLTKSLDAVTETNLLLLVGPAEPDRRTKFYSWFMNSDRAVACESLSPRQAESFARRRIEEHGATISDAALARLLACTGSDAGVIARETEKLALFAGEKAEITAAAVDTVAGHSAGCTVEDLVSAAVAGRLPEALNFGRRLQESGMEPASLIGRLMLHFFDLERARQVPSQQVGRLASALRLPRSRVEQIAAWLKHSRSERVGMALEHLALADRLVRSGRTDTAAVCDQLIVALAGAGDRPAIGSGA